jgi:hypothetical protein
MRVSPSTAVSVTFLASTVTKWYQFKTPNMALRKHCICSAHNCTIDSVLSADSFTRLFGIKATQIQHNYTRWKCIRWYIQQTITAVSVRDKQWKTKAWYCTGNARLLKVVVYIYYRTISPFERHSPWFFIPLTAKSTRVPKRGPANCHSPFARRANVNCQAVHGRLLSTPRYRTRRTRAQTTSSFQNIIRTNT